MSFLPSRFLLTRGGGWSSPFPSFLCASSCLLLLLLLLLVLEYFLCDALSGLGGGVDCTKGLDSLLGMDHNGQHTSSQQQQYTKAYIKVVTNESC